MSATEDIKRKESSTCLFEKSNYKHHRKKYQEEIAGSWILNWDLDTAGDH